MKEFYDTSALIAAFWDGHPDHGRSLQRFAAANRGQSACAAHSLTEVYAGMTALPVKQVAPPEQALLFVQEVRQRCTVVTLDEDEYFETLERAAERGLKSGRVYDALILACAAKVDAEAIFTWNLKHFRAIDPDLADRIQTP